MKTATLTTSERELFCAIRRSNLDRRTVKKSPGANPLPEKEKT